MEGVVLLEINDEVFLCDRPLPSGERLRHSLYTYSGNKSALFDIRLSDFNLKMQLRNKDFEIPVFKDYDFTIKNYDSKYSISSLNWVGKKVVVWMLYPDLTKRLIVNGRLTKTKADFENINISISDDRKYDLETEADDWYFFGDNNIRKISDNYFSGEARYGHQVTEFNGKLYLTGGRKQEHTSTDSGHFNDVWVSSNGRTWTELTGGSKFPQRAHHQCIAYHGALYLIGGQTYSDRGSLARYRDVWRSFDGNTWEERYSMPDGYAYHATVIFHDTIYTIGGVNGEDEVSSDILRKRDDDTWERIHHHNTLPTIYQHQAVIWQDEIYIVGGRSSRNDVGTEDVYYSGDARHWNTDYRARFKGITGHQLVVSNGKMWVIGGNSRGSAGKFISNNEVSSIFPRDNNWSISRSSYTFSRRGEHQAVVFQNKIFIYGGIDYQVHLARENIRTDAWAICDGGDDFEGLEQYINARFLKNLSGKILNESYFVRDVKFDIFGEKNFFDVLKKIIERLFLYMIRDSKSENYWLRPIDYKSEEIRTLTPNINFSIERTSDNFYSDFTFKDYSGRAPYNLSAKAAIKIYFGINFVKKYEIQTFFESVRSITATGPIVEFFKRYSHSRFALSFETTDDIKDLLLYDTVNIPAKIREFSYGKNFQGRIMKIDYSKSALEIECLLQDSIDLH